MGIDFSDMTLNETINYLSEIIDEPYQSLTHVITANPEIAMKILNDKEMQNVAEKAELITPDGIGIVFASKMLGGAVKERVSGFDIVVELMRKRNNERKSLKIYALGANQETISLAVKNIENQFTNVQVVGFHDGYFNSENESKIVKEINECKPDLLLVGLGSPKQEQFISKHKPYFNTKVAIGVGGTFDVLSGKVKRAPVLIQKMNLEWFYRLVNNPKRLVRQASLFIFGFKVLVEAITQKSRKTHVKG